MLKRFLAIVCVFFGVAAAAQTPPYTEGVKLADIEANFIDEASGMADSRVNPGVIWLHNDSGDGAYLYAVDRKGKTKAVYLVRSAGASDWEDMAWGPGPDGKGNFLYMGDIGDNPSSRTDAAVYRIAEPKIGATVGSKKDPLLTEEPTVRRAYQFPDGAHNAEALLCHPKTGILYIVTKEPSGVASVYKFPAEPENWWEKNTLTKVGTVTITDEKHPYPNLITGGAISPDGTKVILRTYLAAYELKLPEGAAEFDSIWNTRPTPILLPPVPQGEAICYSVDGRSVLTTSEKAPAPLIELKAK